jgi:hypothetical protein
MGVKRYCDVCGVEISDSLLVPHNEAVKMYSGTFVYGAVVVDESDDLCRDCGAKVRDFIRQLKKEAQP